MATTASPTSIVLPPRAPAATDGKERGDLGRLVVITTAIVVAGAAGFALVRNPVAELAIHLSIVAAIATWAWRDTDRRTGLGLDPDAARRSLGIALGAATIAAVAVAIGAVVSGQGTIDPTQVTAESVRWRVLVEIPLATVLLEELVFRGWLLRSWHASTRSEVTAVAVTSIAFGLWHVVPELHRTGSASSAVIAVAATAAASAFVLCPLRLRTSSLLAPALLHWFVNAGVVLALFVASAPR